MAFQIIGIVGLARHGKDSVAQELVKLCGYQRISLADKLKEEVAEHYEGLDGFDLETLMHGNKGPVQRRVLQLWGTEARRAIFPDYWLWQWGAKALKATINGKPGVVVADVRFPNEADYLKNLGGYIFGVNRGDFRDPTVNYEHASERHCATLMKHDCDVIVPNLGTLEDLSKAVACAARSLGLIE